MSPLDLVRAVRQMNTAALQKLSQESGVSIFTLWHLRQDNRKRGPTMRTLQKLWETMDGNPEYSTYTLSVGSSPERPTDVSSRDIAASWI